MSGAHAKWTPERRAAQAERMRAANYDPEYVAKRNAGMKSEFNRLRKASQMRAINRERKENPKVRAKWIANLQVALKRADRCEKLSIHMKALNRYWRQQPDVGEFFSERARRALITRRGIVIPDELMPDYLAISRKVGMREAVRVISIEIQRLGA